MRRIQFVNDEYYHIYNRGYNKQHIFLSDGDKRRFLFNLLYFQSPIIFSNIDRLLTASQHNVQHPVLNILEKEETEEVIQHRFVELVVFTLMPNHFHAIVRQIKDTGISRYMQRVLDSYTKFFNKKYERTGHLFQGPYQVVQIESNEQLLYLSAYIHRNPRELSGYREHRYPWSSYQDYIHKNRWGELLKQEIILDQFSSAEEYRDLVEHSGAKINAVQHRELNINDT